MKSTNQLANSLVFELIGRVVVDPTAVTCQEISTATGKNMRKVQQLVKDELVAGTLEKVLKRSGRQLVAAYRLKRK